MKEQPNTPYLIVELANSHGGDKSVLSKLIEEFGGLDYDKKGIKFQIFHPDKIALDDFEWYSVYRDLFFENSVWADLILHARNHGDVWIDIFDIYGVEVASENLGNIKGIKLQASVLENSEVYEGLKTLDFSGKSLIVNVSGLEVSEIQDVVEKFSKICSDLIVQIGFQSYPTKIEDTALSKIPVIKSLLPGVPVCMADHSDAETDFASQVPIYAFVKGCSYIEKHFCLDRNSAKYDGYSALNPSQMASVCGDLKNAAIAITGHFISKPESEYLEKSIQIPVLQKGVKMGSLISESDCIYRRTGQKGIRLKEILEQQSKRKVLNKEKEAFSTIDIHDFKAANVAAIVAGRMKSTRLSQKAILPLSGVSAVERCLSQCLAVSGVDQVILATSDLEEDGILENYNLNGKAKVWRGHPDDVVNRYLGACDKFDIDVVVRVTADCPLVLPEIIEYLLCKHFESGADYTAAEDCAVGSAGEIINTSALKRIMEYCGEAPYSEYMTWYFRNNPEFFKINIVELPHDLVRGYRMTLDYEEDLKMFQMLFSKLDCGQSSYSASEVFSVLDSSPEISEINGHLTLKYRTDKDLIDLLNRETKIG